MAHSMVSKTWIELEPSVQKDYHFLGNGCDPAPNKPGTAGMDAAEAFFLGSVGVNMGLMVIQQKTLGLTSNDFKG